MLCGIRCQCTFMNEIIHLLLGLPRFLVSPGRPELNAGFPSVVCLISPHDQPCYFILSLLIVSMISRTLEFIMASLSLQVALKFPSRFSGIDPKFFKNCLKLLDFLKSCRWSIYKQYNNIFIIIKFPQKWKVAPNGKSCQKVAEQPVVKANYGLEILADLRVRIPQRLTMNPLMMRF